MAGGRRRPASPTFRPPRHLHVSIFRYRSLMPDGQTFGFSTAFSVVAQSVDDAQAKVDRMRASDQKLEHIQAVTECADPAHLKED